MSKESLAEQIAIANLALHFIPAIDLPKDWETAGERRLTLEIAVPTTGMHPDKSSTWTRRETTATPFEIVSEEAVKRARILWAAVKGKRRPERVEFDPALALQALQERHYAVVMAPVRREEAFTARSAPLEKGFASIAGERDAITEAEFLAIVFDGSKTEPEQHVKFLRAFQEAEAKRLGDEYLRLEVYSVPATVIQGMRFQDFVEKNRKWLTKFTAIAGERPAITETEFLNIVFTNTKWKHQQREKFLRAFHEKADKAGKVGDGFSPLEHYDLPAVLDLGQRLLVFVEKNKGWLRTKWVREGTTKGGKTTAKKARKEKGIIGLTKAEKKKLAKKAAAARARAGTRPIAKKRRNRLEPPEKLKTR